MAYQIDRFNKSPLTTVEDGTLDETTDIKFVGKNYAGYGEIHNENFLFLLENFAGANQPPKPVSGQLWFDSGSDRMKFRDGNQNWRTVGGAEVSGAQPAGLAEGDFWWDSANEQLYVYNGSNFVLIGPQDAGEGQTAMISRTVLDNTSPTGVSRSIITATVNDSVEFVISPVAFTLGSGADNEISGFSDIKQGVTLRDTPASGVTSTAVRFHGTATNADKLGGLSSGDFVQGGSPSFASQLDLSAGLVTHSNFYFTMRPDNQTGLIKNTSANANQIDFELKAPSTGTLTHSVAITAGGIMPGVASTDLTLGESGNVWDEVHATAFKGTADNANQLRLGNSGSSYTYATESNVGGTIAVRQQDGANTKLVADIFQGTATQAQFADLAEKYTVEKDHPVGTVMYVSTAGEYEIAPCLLDSYPVGVISEKPAYLMNAEADGQAIALEGRVPVRCIGEIRKGDKVYVDAEGCASTKFTGNPLVGIALESNLNEEEKLVECILKL
jgi:hypothetical protein